jgi:hypothetical protein
MTPAALAVLALLTPTSAPNPRMLSAAAHREPVAGLAFTADGRGLVTADHAGTVVRWDLAAGKPVRVTKLGPFPDLAHPHPVVAPGGRFVAVGASAGQPQVFDAETGKVVATLPRPLLDADSWTPVFSADGTRVAFGYTRGHGSPREGPANVVVWDLAKNRAAGTVEIPVPPGGIVRADIALSADSTRLAAVVSPAPATRGDDGTELGVWVVATGKRFAARVVRVELFATAVFPGDGWELLFNHLRGYAVWAPDGYRLRDAAFGPWHTFGPPVPARDGRTFVAQIAKGGSIWGGGLPRPQVALGVVETATLALRETMTREGEFDFRWVGAIHLNGCMLATNGPGKLLIYDLNPATAKLSEPDELWKSLAGTPPKAGVAIHELVNRPTIALTLFRDKLAPAGEAASSEADTAKLIAALDAPAFADREAAGKKLLASLRHVEPALRAALAAATSPEQKQRLTALLAAADKFTPDELRHIRAMEVLERIGTPAAADLARTLAGGAVNAVLTREAKATLARLKR